jgi:hypothetical protein
MNTYVPNMATKEFGIKLRLALSNGHNLVGYPHPSAANLRLGAHPAPEMLCSFLDYRTMDRVQKAGSSQISHFYFFLLGHSDLQRIEYLIGFTFVIVSFPNV